MTLDTVSFNTPTMFATVASEAPTRRAPMTMPLWDSVRSHISLHHLHTTTLTAEILSAADRGRSTGHIENKKDRQLHHVLYSGRPNLMSCMTCFTIFCLPPV
ncbi:hypothetical protein C0J52_20215 [Blattella germanica]|nr:hypothetical protein C0J52_20215 [Blattella germanica]